MREPEGRYYGLGITIQSIDGDITVMSIFSSPTRKDSPRRHPAKVGDLDEGLDHRPGRK
jgi:hypothetical protein